MLLHQISLIASCNEAQCLQLIQIHSYLYGFYVVYTDIRILCAIIRKQDYMLSELVLIIIMFFPRILILIQNILIYLLEI